MSSPVSSTIDAHSSLSGAMPTSRPILMMEPGVQRVYHVSIMKIGRLVGIAPDSDAWEGIVEDTGELVEAFFEQV